MISQEVELFRELYGDMRLISNIEKIVRHLELRRIMEPSSFEEGIRLADEALYMSKVNGRNKVTLSR